MFSLFTKKASDSQARPEPQIQIISKPEIIKSAVPGLLNLPEKKYNSLEVLNWEVKEASIYDSKGHLIKGYKQILRDDTGELLNLAKVSYIPTKNEIFTNFVYALSEFTGWKVEKFGEVQNGKKVMAFLRRTDTSEINGYKTKEFLCVGNAHDYSSTFFASRTSHMVRCENQFTGANRAFSFAHTSGKQEQIKNFSLLQNNIIDISHLQNDKFSEMQNTKISLSDKTNFMKYVLNVEELKGRNFEKLEKSITRETAELGQNIFGLFNGGTYFSTHEKQQKNKVFGNVFGGAANFNKRAFNFCEGLLNN